MSALDRLIADGSALAVEAIALHLHEEERHLAAWSARLSEEDNLAELIVALDYAGRVAAAVLAQWAKDCGHDPKAILRGIGLHLASQDRPGPIPK